MACGSVIGLERSRRLKGAGIRTHSVVAAASCLLMIISKYGFTDLVVSGMEFAGTKGADPSRIAAQIVSGVSFLGVGIIYRDVRYATKGLTTAAGIWAVAAIGMSPLQGDMNALIATCSEYTYLTSGKRVDGTMYSCTSLGTKLGGGIGTALAGWLLAFSGYVGKAAEQSASTLNMLHIMYLWMPMIFNLLITLILTRLNVEQANEELRAEKAGM